MRDIKYRVWDTQEKKMFKVYALMRLGGVSPPLARIVGRTKVPSSSRRYYPSYSSPTTDMIDFERGVVMQYTGLNDKNGVGIYEGDVVTTGNGLKRIVIYDAPGFWLAKNLTDKIDIDSFSTPRAYEEVIGNIYENPELLELAS
ncbi:hypothetical protein DVS77_21660 [Mycolicibacterium moriokaense]|nr:hypothetical protein DVS77_21660 [Mycolicibacterium moriokaense]